MASKLLDEMRRGTTAFQFSDLNLCLSNACLAIAALCDPHYDESMSFSETIFLFFLALLVFGPKKLPEIARQAGKLLAELRRASNEFKAQIETEIAHLEVEKKQAILPPVSAPAGTVASLSLNPAATEAAPHASSATLAAPVDGTLVATADSAEGNATDVNSIKDAMSAAPGAPAAGVDLEVAAASQDSHA
jgi:TatA/E family protein of Tat protein translocase